MNFRKNGKHYAQMYQGTEREKVYELLDAFESNEKEHIDSLLKYKMILYQMCNKPTFILLKTLSIKQSVWQRKVYGKGK